MAKVLLVEDDVTFTKILTGFLEKKGHVIEVAYDLKNAVKQIEQTSYELFLLDYRLPDGTGLDVLAAARRNNQQAPAIIMTSFNDVRTAVKSMRSGAFDYITKPVNQEEFIMVINEALEKKNNKKRITLSGFVEGTSDSFQRLKEHFHLVAPTNMSVILQGESGTGKEYVARSIHNLSKRSDGPFVAVDCGALSHDLAAGELFGHVKGAFTGALNDKKGQFELAEGGTLFLDEIGNLSYEIQVKLLRALQERVIQPLGSGRTTKVDVRIISATNEDLHSLVGKGVFREDLYHRLNEFKIQVPPLRNRDKDIDLFLEHFVNEANQDFERNVQKISDSVREIFYQYDWPGNLRELNNVVRRMVLLTKGNEVEKESLPAEMLLSLNGTKNIDGPDLKAWQESTERELIIKTLQEVKYNKTKAAKLLNIDRKTLYSKIERYGLE